MSIPHVFISYASENCDTVSTVKSIVSNPNNTIKFVDRSLPGPILNAQGDVNRRPPDDPVSQPVKDAICSRMKDAGKLLVLIGPNTHSRTWVKWEIDTFRKYHRSNPAILLMRIPKDKYSGKPNNIDDPVQDWDSKLLEEWLGH